MIARLAMLASPLLAKIALGLAAAVLVLAPMSLWLGKGWYDSSRECAADRALEIAVAIEQGRTQAYQETATRASLIATLAQQDNSALTAELRAIAERGRETRTVYRDRVSKIAPATCAPGADRVEAANALIGGQP